MFAANFCRTGKMCRRQQKQPKKLFSSSSQLKNVDLRNPPQNLTMSTKKHVIFELHDGNGPDSTWTF